MMECERGREGEKEREEEHNILNITRDARDNYRKIKGRVPVGV
jgi:hypothetical protein